MSQACLSECHCALVAGENSSSADRSWPAHYCSRCTGYRLLVARIVGEGCPHLDGLARLARLQLVGAVRHPISVVAFGAVIDYLTGPDVPATESSLTSQMRTTWLGMASPRDEHSALAPIKAVTLPQ